MSKIGNRELAKILAEKFDIDRIASEKFVTQMFDVVNEGLKYDKQVKVKGLGTFKVMSVASRKSVDVNTGEPIVIEGRDKISFTADATMRDLVNRPFAQFETVVINDGVDFDEIDRKFAEFMADSDELLEEDGDFASDKLNDSEELATRVSPAEQAAAPAQSLNHAAEKAAEGLSSDVVAPLMVSNSQLAMLNDGVSRSVEVSEGQRVNEEENICDKASEEHERITEKGLDEAKTDEAREQVLSVSMTQLAMLNAETKPVVCKSEEDESKADEHQEKAVGDKPETHTKTENEEAANANGVEQTESREPLAVLEKNANHESLEMIRLQTMELTEQMQRNRRHIKTFAWIATFLLLACAGSMLYMASLLGKKNNRIKHLEAETAAMTKTEKQNNNVAETSDSVVVDQATTDSLAIAMKQAEKERQRQDSLERAKIAKHKALLAQKEREIEDAIKRAQARKDEVGKKTEETKVAAVKAAEENTQSQYNHDIRIRTGAYIITGIDRTVTVGAGQTLTGISKANLGPGMECYVEAVNGGKKEFKVGEKVKIPKLKLKKK